MKKILFIIGLIALMATSCQRKGLSTYSKPDKISFVPSSSVATKAAFDGTTFPDTCTFILSAYYNADEGSSENYFSKIGYTRNALSGKWDADKFWPQNGSLDFLAASYNGVTVSNIVYSAKVSESVSFDVPDNSTAQADIMHASAKNQTYSASGTKLTFKHSEALLIWTAGATEAYDATKNIGITVNKVTLKNAKYSGHLVISAEEDGDNGYSAWNSLSDQKDKDLPGLTTYNVPATPMDIALAGNHMGIGSTGILVPEQAQTSFVVYYTFHNGKDASGNALDTDMQYTYICSGNWVEGKKYNYTITFDINQIKIIPSIEDWLADPVAIRLPEPVAATYSVNNETSVSLPKAVLAANSEVMVDWGDGSTEAFTNSATKSSIKADTLNLSHTYSPAFTGKASIVVRKGNMDFDEIPAADLAKFTITDETKFKAKIEKPNLLSGVFTVCASPLKKVKFSRGNLMANVNATGDAVLQWKLAYNQYDYIGNTTSQQQCKDGWVDLFGWMAAGKYSDGVKQYGIYTSVEKWDYVKDGTTDQMCDWGSLIESGMTVLSEGEWEYLISNNVAKNSKNKVQFEVAGIKGSILKPDGFSGTVNDSYTAEEWETAEAEGLVFIPFAGYREDSVRGAGTESWCWSSTPSDQSDSGAYNVVFYNDASWTIVYRNKGQSVRLVSEVK